MRVKWGEAYKAPGPWSERCQVEHPPASAQRAEEPACASVSPSVKRHLNGPSCKVLLGGFHKFMPIKHLTQCLACSQLSKGYSLSCPPGLRPNITSSGQASLITHLPSLPKSVALLSSSKLRLPSERTCLFVDMLTAPRPQCPPSPETRPGTQWVLSVLLLGE